MADRETVALRVDGVEVDRSRALQGIRSADLITLLDLYVGPFCAHLDVGRAPEFERWLEAERGHLQRVVVDAVAEGLARRLADGATEEALAGARRMVAVAPDAAEFLAVLTDALVVTGGLAEARERLEAQAAQLEAAGRPLPPSLGDRLDRLRRTGIARPFAAGTLEGLGRTLVGREGTVSALLREAELARAGASRRVALVAPAGMGKTRLLDEFEARMRLRGARVVRVRFLPGMRAVPFAGVADLVRSLAALPGALGISGASARALIGLVPELADRYAVARMGELGPLADSLLARREAVADLLAAVSEDRLVLVLIDDLQYADEASRDLLVSLPRATTSRLLELYAARPGLDPGLVTPDAELVLAPLRAIDVRLLLGEVAVLPDAPWVSELLDEVVHRVRGVPQALLAALRALVESGALRLEAGEWTAPVPEELSAAIARADGVPQAIGALSAAERRVLRVLAAWARPMEEVDLVALLGEGAPVRAMLNRLAALGLVQSRDATWAVAHDAIVEAIEAEAAPAGEVAPLELFIAHWSGSATLTLAVVEHLALLCGSSGDLAAARRLVARVAGRRRWRELGVRGRGLVRMVARAAGRPEWEVPLEGAVGFLARRSDRGLAFLGAGLASAAGGVIWLLAMLQPRLVMETEPLAESAVTSATTGGRVGAFTLIVQPRVAVRNGFGARLAISVPLRVTVPGSIVRGDSVVLLRDGRHQFERLIIERPDSIGLPASEDWRIDLSGPWYVRGASIPIRGQGAMDVANEFRPVRLRVSGGTLVGPMHVRAKLGDSLRFDFTFEYSTIESTANYLVAASPTWGDRREAVIRLAGLPSPVQAAWRTVTFSVAPPPQPGMHHIVILYALEDVAANIFSSTNWTIGQPIWFDGNDVVDLPASTFEALRARGWLRIPRFLHQSYRGKLPEPRVDGRIVGTTMPAVPTTYDQRDIQGTAIRIDVDTVPTR